MQAGVKIFLLFILIFPACEQDDEVREYVSLVEEVNIPDTVTVKVNDDFKIKATHIGSTTCSELTRYKINEGN